MFLCHRDDVAEVAEPHRARRLRARVREEPGRGRFPDVVLGEVDHGFAEVARRRGRVARAPRAKGEAERRHRKRHEEVRDLAVPGLDDRADQAHPVAEEDARALEMIAGLEGLDGALADRLGVDRRAVEEIGPPPQAL